MIEKDAKALSIIRTFALSGIIAAVFYFTHVIVGRIIWPDYNPLTQPVSDLSATSAISQPVVSKILWGYNLFNLLFCGVLLVFFKNYYPINKIFYSGLILKATAEMLSTFGYALFPLSDTSWENSLQNNMHYGITAVIVVSYITLSILLALGLSRTKSHPKMTHFLQIFSIVFIASGFLTVLAAQLFPEYVGLVERVNLYSLMALNIALTLWIRNLIAQQGSQS